MNCLYLLLLLCCCTKNQNRTGRAEGNEEYCIDRRDGCGCCGEEGRRDPSETCCPCQGMKPEPPCMHPETPRPEPRPNPPLPRPFPPFADEQGCGCGE